MKIGIDGRLIDKIHNTGISRYTCFLIDYYVEKYGRQNIYIITNDSKFKLENYNMIYTSLKPYNLIHFLFYRGFISTLNLDAVHIPFYSGVCFSLPNTKLVVTVHDLMYRLVSKFFGKNRIINYCKIKYFDFIVKKTVKNANVVISVSETTRDDLFTFCKVKSIHIPEYSEIQTKSDVSILKKLNIERKNFFLYCGNNRHHKNLEFIKEIFDSLNDIPPLVLAGKGHVGSHNIISAGTVTESELKALYDNSIAFIFPSKYEGFGLPVLEALYAKTFVIASKIPAFMEFNSKNILYFEIGDSRQLIENLQQVQIRKFINEPCFFARYSKKNIYKLLDKII